MKRMRFGIVGCGFIAPYHLKGIRDSGKAECTTITSKSEKSRNGFASKYGVPRVFDSYEEMVSSEEVDAVVLCLPNVYHAEYAIRALESGLHVLVEKPMACSLAEAQQMKETAEKAGRVLMVGHMWRFDQEVLFVAAAVQSGKLGNIFKTKGYGIHVNWGPKGWFTEKSMACGGALVDMGIHAIDTVRFILGDPKPVQIYADVGTYIGDFDVDDTATLMIRWDNDAVSIVESGWWHPHMDGPEAATAIFGINGYAGLFPTVLEYSFNGRLGTFHPDFPERKEHCSQELYTRQIAEFIRAVEEGEDPNPGAAEGLTALAICEAAYTSALEKRAVDI